ncbi:MAG: hypothetical protein IPM02_00705 [Betaproteobacteria bacterium]|nr:hypothetical protein [Betaproteobacteria bacterium]
MPDTIGWLDQPAAAVLTTASNAFSGWALSRNGVARVDLVIDGRMRLPATLGVGREDVRSVYPNFPDNGVPGFEAKVDLGDLPMGHHEIEVIATDRTGVTTLLGKRTYVNEDFRWTWAGLLAARGHRPNEVFHYVFATSHVAQGGGAQIDTDYAPYLSDTVKVGVRVPILSADHQRAANRTGFSIRISISPGHAARARSPRIRSMACYAGASSIRFRCCSR